LYALIKAGKLAEAKEYNLKKIRHYIDLFMTGTDKGYP
jgi:hypothetical protein